MGEPHLFFFGNNRSNRTTDMEENVPPQLVFWLLFSQCGGFWGKNVKAVFGTPFPIEKVIFIFVLQHPIPWKMAMSPKNYLLRLFWKKNFFFEKNCYMKQIQNLISYNKVYTDFCRQTPPSPQNDHILSQMVFRNFFNINWRTSVRCSYSKIYSFERKFMENKLHSYKIFAKCITFGGITEWMQKSIISP